MTYSSYQIKVPGKLFIAGEYAILDPTNQAIVIAVDRYMSANIEPRNEKLLSLPQLGLDCISWEAGDKNIQIHHKDTRLQFIENAMSVAYQFLSEQRIKLQSFHLSIKSELNDRISGRKYGLGSSAAVVVGVISAMLTLHIQRSPLTLDQIFKLSALAHLKTQKNGSGADIAASIFGGWICYSSFDTGWVVKEWNKGTKLSQLINKPWPNLVIDQIQPPTELRLCVGWTKTQALTPTKIKQYHEFRDRNETNYQAFLKESSSGVTRLLKGFKQNNCHHAISGLKENRNALLKLSELAGFTIETGKLKELVRIAEQYGSGKSSGAGGGDCGIAFLYGDAHVDQLQKEWREHGMIPLNIGISKFGATITEYNCEPNLKEYFFV